MIPPAHNNQTARFWAILTIVNVVVMTYPVRLYLQADTADAQLLATAIVVGVGFVLAVTDAVSAIMKYMA